MAHPKNLRNLLRSKYIQGLPLTEAAERVGVSAPTAQRWKRESAGAGDDWDTARTARMMSSQSGQDVTLMVLNEMSSLLLSTIDELKKATNLSALQRSEMLVRIADTHIKMLAAAGRANPAVSALGVSMDVLRSLHDFVTEKHPEKRAWMVACLEEFGPVIAAQFGS